MSGCVGVDNTSRRKFRDEYAQRKLEQERAKAKQRALEEEEDQKSGNRKPLHPPVIDFKSQVGKTTLCASPDVGFTCEICNCTKKDHLSLLDHLNSQEHLNAVGVSESAKKVTAADVRNKLSKHKLAVEDPVPAKKKKSKKHKESSSV